MRFQCCFWVKSPGIPREEGLEVLRHQAVLPDWHVAYFKIQAYFAVWDMRLAEAGGGGASYWQYENVTFEMTTRFGLPFRNCTGTLCSWCDPPYVLHDAFIYVAWLILVCVWHDSWYMCAWLKWWECVSICTFPSIYLSAYRYVCI